MWRQDEEARIFAFIVGGIGVSIAFYQAWAMLCVS